MLVISGAGPVRNIGRILDSETQFEKFTAQGHIISEFFIWAKLDRQLALAGGADGKHQSN
jgi:hypothetical protein